MQYNKANHCIWALNYHLVLTTKYRRKCINSDMMSRLRDITSMRCIEKGGYLKEFNGESDHVHMLIALPPPVALSSFVNTLKTTSSRLIRKEFASHVKQYFTGPAFWNSSYFVSSTGGAPFELIKQYISDQGMSDKLATRARPSPPAR